MSNVRNNINALLANAEKTRGLPSGLLGSILHQETGGKQKYIDNPSEYHYAPNAQGKRVAGHTGKVSTAFGPFGLLESTGAKPGYGVAPLKDKSLEEQIRFAADYVGARIKHAGSVEKGLAGYGEGPAYANSVLRRIGKGVPQIPEIGSIKPNPIPQIPATAPQVPAETVYSVAKDSGVVPIQQVPSATIQQEPSAYRGLANSLLDQNRVLQQDSDLLKRYYENAVEKSTPVAERTYDMSGLANALAKKSYGYETNIGNNVGKKTKSKLNFTNLQ